MDVTFVIGNKSWKFQDDTMMGTWWRGDETLWCHQMFTFSVSVALCVGNSPVTGEFPSQRPVTWSFNVLLDPYLKKQFGKHLWHWWFVMPSLSLWHHCNYLHRIWNHNSSISSGPIDHNWSEDITVTSHEHHGVSKWIYPTSCWGLHRRQHQSLALHYWTIVRGIDDWWFTITKGQ